MSELVAKLEQLAKPLVEMNGAFLVEVIFRGDHHQKIAEVFIDSDDGVTADLCEKISHSVSSVLNDSNLFINSYSLVVSSPGLDRPIKLLRQYKKNIGRMLSVKFRNVDLLETVKGTLLEVQDSLIILQIESSKTLEILFGNIVEAKVIPVIRKIK